MTCTCPRTERRTCLLPGREMVLASRVRCMRGDARMRTAFPSSATSGRPVSSVRLPAGEKTRCQPTDRPRSAFPRVPAKEHVIRQTGTPSTVANAVGEEGVDCSTPTCSASVPRSRRPHLFPRERCFSRGIASAMDARSPASTAFERRAPLGPAGKPAPGTDDPSAPAWLERARPGRG